MSFELLPNARSIHNITFPSVTQARIWKQRQLGLSTTEIATELNATLAYVSKTIRITNKKIKLILEDTARSNFIHLEKISELFGFAIGFSHMLERRAFISFQPSIGVHIWYSHNGYCPECPLQQNCNLLLTQEANERGIEIPSAVELETDKADYLIKQICKKIGWKSF